jgi:hypothetical protein
MSAFLRIDRKKGGLSRRSVAEFWWPVSRWRRPHLRLAAGQAAEGEEAARAAAPEAAGLAAAEQGPAAAEQGPAAAEQEPVGVDLEAAAEGFFAPCRRASGGGSVGPHDLRPRPGLGQEA